MSSSRYRGDPEEEVLPSFQDTEPSESLRGRVLASIEPASRLEGFAARFARLFDLPEARAREILAAAGAVPGPGWVDTPLPGLRLYHFAGGPRFAQADCGLVHLAADTPFPTHRHVGREWNLVLAGGAEDDTGACWLPGDLVILEAGSVHGFRAQPGEALLYAVVLEGGIEIVGVPASGPTR